MGFWSFLLGSTPQGAMAEVAGGAAQGLMSGIGDLALKIREAITGDLPPEVKGKLAQIAAEAEALNTQGQIAINLEEAKSEKLFKSGWRPSVGWACSSAVWYTYVFQPFAAFSIQALAWRGAPTGTPFPALPALNMSDVLMLLAGLLGIGTLRTFEKMQGVAK